MIQVVIKDANMANKAKEMFRIHSPLNMLACAGRIARETEPYPFSIRKRIAMCYGFSMPKSRLLCQQEDDRLKLLLWLSMTPFTLVFNCEFIPFDKGVMLEGYFELYKSSGDRLSGNTVLGILFIVY